MIVLLRWHWWWPPAPPWHQDTEAAAVWQGPLVCLGPGGTLGKCLEERVRCLSLSLFAEQILCDICTPQANTDLTTVGFSEVISCDSSTDSALRNIQSELRFYNVYSRYCSSPQRLAHTLMTFQLEILQGALDRGQPVHRTWMTIEWCSSVGYWSRLQMLACSANSDVPTGSQLCQSFFSVQLEQNREAGLKSS